mmetsp:Transcript_33747/g.97333  ORF Transcript_33747/g.97333 Transcript_33747/m.97333 type:complete len:309 (+) Transcript_33747:32-958(+)
MRSVRLLFKIFHASTRPRSRRPFSTTSSRFSTVTCVTAAAALPLMSVLRPTTTALCESNGKKVDAGMPAKQSVPPFQHAGQPRGDADVRWDLSPELTGEERRFLEWAECIQQKKAVEKDLYRRAKGDVLEVGIGESAPSLGHYDMAQVSSLTAVDRKPMQLPADFDPLHPTRMMRRKSPCQLTGTEAISHRSLLLKLSERAVPFRFVNVNVEDTAGLPLPFPAEAFDSVVSCEVLCCLEEPHLLLMDLLRVCRPGGQMLLLEHGRPPQEALRRHPKYQDDHTAASSPPSPSPSPAATSGVVLHYSDAK